MIELADIFRQHGQQYRKKFGDRIPLSHLQAMRDIQRCRTEALGGQTYRCPDCEHVLYSYHSSRRTSGRCAAIVIVPNAKMKMLNAGWKSSSTIFYLYPISC